jgi:hypothetical protein
MVIEAQEVEAAGFEPLLSCRPPGRGTEEEQAGLLGVQLEAVLGETSGEPVEDGIRIVSFTEDQDEVVGVADQVPAALQSRGDVLLEPLVQDVVKVDVGQQR